MFHPFLELGAILFGAKDNQIPTCAPLQIGVQFPLQPAPDPVGFHHQWNFRRVAALLSDEAPVAAGLLAGYPALFAHHRLDTLLRQIPGGCRACDARADYDDVSVRGYISHRLEPCE